MRQAKYNYKSKTSIEALLELAKHGQPPCNTMPAWEQTKDSDFDHYTLFTHLTPKPTAEQLKQLKAYAENITWRERCGCQHDCCGCTYAQSSEVVKISRGQYRFYFSQSKNY